MVSNNLYRVVASLVLAMLFCLVSNVGKAEEFGDYPTMFPIYTPSPPTITPPSSTLLPPTVPSTPVPPIPSDLILYQLTLTELSAVNAEIDTVNADIALYQFLLMMSPNDLMIQTHLNMLTFQLTSLSIEKQILVNYMLTLSP